MEQYSRHNMVEIFGIPESQNENGNELILKVCRELGVNFGPEVISSSHRLRKFGNQTSAGIIVQFVRRKCVDDVLRMRREKRYLTAQQIGFHKDDSPIYVNLALSPNRRRLLAEAKKIKKLVGLKFVWVDRAGSVKIRENGGSRVKTIDDLNAFTVVSNYNAVQGSRGE
ncbi:uncharacterized protein LOC120349615 [Nilaparvata lugens]|uniref:uncharacterized protein LOC120349615 n=1 Tax=Nilaparvata lugens TaxID=108931 RepID=UPI00193E293F|nr:uncharacterized protein LOC120349615 [Nilaparvata lugens]